MMRLELGVELINSSNEALILNASSMLSISEGIRQAVAINELNKTKTKDRRWPAWGRKQVTYMYL